MRGYGKARRAATSSSYQTGDLLRRDLSWYADHYGVYLGRYQGQEWVIEVTRLADQPEPTSSVNAPDKFQEKESVELFWTVKFPLPTRPSKVIGYLPVNRR